MSSPSLILWSPPSLILVIIFQMPQPEYSILVSTLLQKNTLPVLQSSHGRDTQSNGVWSGVVQYVDIDSGNGDSAHSAYFPGSRKTLDSGTPCIRRRIKCNGISTQLTAHHYLLGQTQPAPLVPTSAPKNLWLQRFAFLYQPHPPVQTPRI